MRPRLLISSLLLSLLAACATPLSQTPPAGMPGEAAAPELQIGQSWRYSVRDGFTNLPRGTVEYVVKAVDANTATVEVHADQRVSTELYTRSGNWLRRPATNMQVFV